LTTYAIVSHQFCKLASITSAIDVQLPFQHLKLREAFSLASLGEWIQRRENSRSGITMALSVSFCCAR
jgi:hypothetical protein